jgi:hypothetical protein
MFAFALFGLAVPMKAASKFPTVLAACSAFGANGGFVIATASVDSLSLSVTSAFGKDQRLTVPLRYQPEQWQLDRPTLRWHLYDCSLFFDHSGDLLAVGITTTEYTRPQKLQIAVADLKTSMWLSNFGVEAEQNFGLSARLRLAGFLSDTKSIVVTNALKASVKTQQRESISAIVFDASGKKLSVQPFVHSQRTLMTFYPDAANNRLWLFHCGTVSARPSQQPFCPISITNLVGDESFSATFDPSHYTKKRTDLWMRPGTFVAPDLNTLLIAESVDGNDTVWRVDVQSQVLDRLVLPQHHFLKYDAMRGGTLSPDADVFAVLLGQYKIAFPYIVDNYVYEGDDIVVLQVKPLRVLGIVPHRGAKYTQGLSVDHRNGKATVLVYRQDHWERRDFDDAQAWK